ncbi:hypothetical protein Pan241w_03150 [Gimesia alba]|uniref:Uncharacterized protein n=1 Tax=Gimesia alba TaxID=2527973 RepID=A0A517R8P2_9PLAN|nr:hypothetical protein [Gimesia alba]QDT40259.1 hypothetical protein Pan241w_03150 [Gimesia alba]
MHALKQKLVLRSFSVLVCGLLVIISAQNLRACPFCPGPSKPLTEQLSQADVAVLASWVEAEEGTLEQSGKTVFEIKELVRQPQNANFKAGTRVTIQRHYPGKTGALFLLLGSRGAQIKWDDPIEVTEASFRYITQAPGLEQATTQRLKYFLKFLEHPDQTIANDAFAEFANAPFEHITPLAQELPREKLQSWLASSKTPVPRLGLYGLLMGLCGQESEIAFMEQKINEPAEELRLGIGGLISGYLMLTGAEGLTKIEQSKFRAKEVAFSETYAAMQALSFIWTFGNHNIKKDRLRASMRLLLDRPELADLAVANLARWEDWSVMDRLMELYGQEDYQNRSVKKAIIRYLMVAAKGKQQSGEGPDAATVEKARQRLDKLRNEDPATVKSAERFF